MNDKEKILKELHEKFEDTKKELKFKATFEEIDEIFFIEDLILKEGFVSNRFDRQLSGRISELYNGWAGYLHNFIILNTSNAASIMENKLFNESEKKEIRELFKKCIEISSRNSLIGLTKDKEEQAKFIDDGVEYWRNIFGEKMITLMKKINKNWGE